MGGCPRESGYGWGPAVGGGVEGRLQVFGWDLFQGWFNKHTRDWDTHEGGDSLLDKSFLDLDIKGIGRFRGQKI